MSYKPHSFVYKAPPLTSIPPPVPLQRHSSSHFFSSQTSMKFQLTRAVIRRCDSHKKQRRVVPNVIQTFASLLCAGGATTPKHIAYKLQIAEWQVRWAMAKIIQSPYKHYKGLGGYLCAHPRHADFWHIQCDPPSPHTFKCTLPILADVRQQQNTHRHEQVSSKKCWSSACLVLRGVVMHDPGSNGVASPFILPYVGVNILLL